MILTTIVSECAQAQQTENGAADLARPRLRQVRDDEDLLGRGEGADDLANLEGELFQEPALVRPVKLELGLERHEGVHGLSGQLIGGANDCQRCTEELGQQAIERSGVNAGRA